MRLSLPIRTEHHTHYIQQETNLYAIQNTNSHSLKLASGETWPNNEHIFRNVRRMKTDTLQNGSQDLEKNVALQVQHLQAGTTKTESQDKLNTISLIMKIKTNTKSQKGICCTCHAFSYKAHTLISDWSCAKCPRYVNKDINKYSTQSSHMQM